MIERIIIADYEERYAPPAKPVLVLGVAKEVVFLTIANFDETNEEAKLTFIAEVGIKSSDLLAAIDSLVASAKKWEDTPVAPDHLQ